MGLDISHDCWHGAYSAFSRWRFKLAEIAGIPLPLMQGYFEYSIEQKDAAAITRFLPSPMDGKDFTWLYSLAVAASRSNLPLKWDQFRHDPLSVLLDHSDSDGEISAKDCKPLADRLTELLPFLPDEEDSGHIGNWKETTQKFINGLRKAAEANEPVRFC